MFETLVIEYAGGELLRVPGAPHRPDRALGLGRRTTRPPRGCTASAGGTGRRTRAEDAEGHRGDDAPSCSSSTRRARPRWGIAYPPDTRWQREMESAFLFEDTPDQRQATEDVKRDMESPRPMDRLICGDVGYGKTEIAIRAAFKAVQDGKQVAVLVPTTILAEQHLHTFAERLAGFPVRIEALSRFRTAKEQREVLERLKAGRGGRRHRHAPPALARRAVPRPGAAGGGRGAALRGEAQGAAEAAQADGGRPDPHRHAHPPHAALLAAGDPRHDADPDAAARPAADHHPRAPLVRRGDRGRDPPRAGPRRAGLLRPQPGGDASPRVAQRVQRAGPRGADRRGARADEGEGAGGGHAPLRRRRGERPGRDLHHRVGAGRARRQHADRGPRRPVRAGAALPDPRPRGALAPPGVLLPPDPGERLRGRGEAAAGAGALHRAGERLRHRAEGPRAAGRG